MTRPERRVTLVIGSGGVKCAASLGLLRVLEREGVELEAVVGCSGGSIFAAAIALGWSAEQATAATLRLWTRELTRRPSRRAQLRALLPKLFGFDAHFGLIDDRAMNERLRTAFAEASFADAKVPLLVTATDLETGERVTLRDGSLADAIRASLAIPYLFRPWPLGGRLLLDGYLSDPLPVGVAVENGARIIVALGFEANRQPRLDSLARYAAQVGSIAHDNLLRARLAPYGPSHHPAVLTILPDFGRRIGAFATDEIPHAIEVGARAMEDRLPRLERLLEADPT